ncbi:MAG: hypothetical protein ACREBW_09675 [Candidatus Micrarchaeaceae archaeon]
MPRRAKKPDIKGALSDLEAIKDMVEIIEDEADDPKKVREVVAMLLFFIGLCESKLKVE